MANSNRSNRCAYVTTLSSTFCTNGTKCIGIKKKNDFISRRIVKNRLFARHRNDLLFDLFRGPKKVSSGGKYDVCRIATMYTKHYFIEKTDRSRMKSPDVHDGTVSVSASARITVLEYRNPDQSNRIIGWDFVVKPLTPRT